MIHIGDAVFFLHEHHDRRIKKEDSEDEIKPAGFKMRSDEKARHRSKHGSELEKNCDTKIGQMIAKKTCGGPGRSRYDRNQAGRDRVTNINAENQRKEW